MHHVNGRTGTSAAHRLRDAARIYLEERAVPRQSRAEPPTQPSRRTPARRRVTLRDVAEHAGVSVTAASFVLNGREDQRIAIATQQRVRDAAEDLGYRPDLTARILRTGTSGTVAVVSDFISTTGYAGGVVRGALEAARQHGSLIYIAETLADEDVEYELLQSMLDRRVDGFVYASMFTREVRVPDPLRDVPLVLLNCTSPDVSAPAVLPDEVAAGTAAARALVDAGHRDGIWFVGALPPGLRGTARWGDRPPIALQQRLTGIRSEFKKEGVRLAGTLKVADWEPSDGRRAVADAVRDGADVRALICVNDRVALGAYQALSAAGMDIPGDVSVVSFDDSELAMWLQPELTSVALPHEELGRAAVDVLLSGARAPHRTLVQMPRRDRGSVGRA
jgi:LacI family transcriptional regulator